MGHTTASAAAITINSSCTDNKPSVEEDANDIIKTKEQNRQEGKRRALAIAIAKQQQQMQQQQMQQQQKLQGSNNKSANSTSTTTTSKRRGNNRKSDRHGARNQHRHKHFARWILQTFPHVVDECTCCSSSDATAATSAATMTTSTEEEDREHKVTSSPPPSSTSIGTHILDIAGGKGELSARLSLCHSLRIRMIDPRPANISDVYMNSVVPKLPKKWQLSIKERLDCRPNFVDDMVNDRFVQLVTYFMIDAPSSSSLDDDDDDDDDDHDDDDDDNRDNEEGRRLFQDESVEDAVRNASLIIGLHADGATEAIVDAALRYNKPFVVVPCCVFPNFFRDRFIYVDDDEDNTGAEDNLRRSNSNNNGSGYEKKKKRVAVRTHEQFCQYLLDKDDRFKKEILPFEGRNVAIWWDRK
jgi:hypothetical protein